MASTKIINVLRTDGFEDVLDVFKSAKAEEVIFVLPKKSKAFSKDQHFASLASASKEVGKNVSIMTASPEIQAIAAAHGFHVLTSPILEPRKRTAAAPKPVVANLAVADEDDMGEEELDDEPAEEGEKDEEESREVPLEELEKEEETHEPKDDDEVGEDLDYEPYLEEPDIDKELEELEDISVKNRNIGRYNVVTASSTTAKAPRTMADILRPADKGGISLKVEKKAEKPQAVDIQRDEAVDIGHVDQRALDEIKKVWESKGDLWTSREESSAPAKKSASSKVPAFGIPQVNSRSFSKKIVLWLAGGAIIVFAAVLYVSIGNAKLIVAPQYQEVDFEMKISTSDIFSSINADQNQIPGQLFNASGNHEGSYPASGERDVAQKARGTLTVYNNLATAQTLITTTRFESSSGMIFRTLTNINVPARGKINVEVIADRPGDLYNVGLDKFTIPAFKEKGDTARFEGIYGESTEPMKGGIVGKAKVVTESDFNTAKNDAEAKAVAEAVDQIKSQSTGLKILDLPNPTLKTSESSARVDEGVQDTFTYKASADVRAIGFKEEDVLSLINSYLDKTNKLVSFKDKIQIDYKNVVLNPDKDSLDFTIAVKGTAYSQIDVGRMKTELIGKNRDQVKTYIDSQSAISSARVNFNPFWVRKIPKDPSNFQIDLEYK